MRTLGTASYFPLAVVGPGSRGFRADVFSIIDGRKWIIRIAAVVAEVTSSIWEVEVDGSQISPGSGRK